MRLTRVYTVFVVAVAMTAFLVQGNSVAQATGSSQGGIERSALHEACVWGNLDEVRRLVNSGVDPAQRGAKEQTPLHVAAFNGHLPIVEFLIASGVAIDAQTNEGWTPLVMAAGKGQLEVTQFLLEKGADPNARLQTGTSPLILIALAPPSSGLTAAVKLLVDNGAKVNVADAYGSTPLHGAVFTGNHELVRYFLTVGADVEAMSASWETPLRSAIMNLDLDMVQLLLNLGASPNASDGAGGTPLLLAKMMGSEEIETILITAGADPGALVDSGMTAQDIIDQLSPEQLEEFRRTVGPPPEARQPAAAPPPAGNGSASLTDEAAIAEMVSELGLEKAHFVLYGQAAQATYSGRVQDALPLAKACVELAERLGGALTIGLSLQLLGKVYSQLPAYDLALDAYERSLPMLAKVEETTPEIILNQAATLLDLGEINTQLHRYDVAGEHYAECAQLLETHAMNDQPLYARMLHSGANHLKQRGRFAEALATVEAAEAKYRQAEKDGWNGAPAGHWLQAVATVAGDKGSVYASMLDYERAAACYVEALEIYASIPHLGDDGPWSAEILTRIAQMSLVTDQAEAALSSASRAAAIFEREMGDEHPRYLSARLLAAKCHLRAEAYKDALEVIDTVLSASKSRAALGDVSYLNALSLKGGVYLEMGDSQRAAETFEQELQLHEAAIDRGPADFNRDARFGTHKNLAMAYWQLGDFERVLAHQDAAIVLTRDFLAHSLLALSSQGRDLLLIRYTNADIATSAAVAVVAQGLTEAAAYGLDAALLFKGLPAEVAAQERSWGVAGGDASWQAAFDRFQLLLAQQAQLQQRQYTASNPEHLSKELAAVATAVQEAETALARQNVVFAQTEELLTATTEEVAAALPENGILLEFVQYDSYEPSGKGAYGEPRYVVYVLGQNWKTPKLVDLGKANLIDAAIERWRQYQTDESATQSGAADTKRANAVSRELYELVMAPIQRAASLPENTHIIVSPDGALALFPFEAFVTNGTNEPSRYLVEDHPVSYVTSGRELVLWEKEAPPAGGGPLVIADPDYGIGFLAELDEDVVQALRMHVHNVMNQGNADSATSADGRSSTATAQAGGLVDTPAAAAMKAGAADCWPEDGTWDDLETFGTMAEEIHARLQERNGDVGPLIRDEFAIETVLKTNRAPRLLVLATHGYYCDTKQWLKRLQREHSSVSTDTMTADATRPDENPLLQSGLVFAGADALPGLLRARQAEFTDPAQSAGMDDGDLTALEVAALNLHGTQLVSLIACQTAVTTVSASGAQGMRSAFRIAGAQATQMSLFDVFVWPRSLEERKADKTLIADGIAFADAFFTRWTAGAGKLEAHHAAQLALLEAARSEAHQFGAHGHPFFWAPFILIGNPN